EAERQAIREGIDAAGAEIRSSGGKWGKEVNGWSYPERHLGNFGNDHLYRAQIALSGLAALEPVEATYLGCSTDAAGQPLDGRNRYVLRFEAGGLPPAHAFWSLSLYEVTPEGRALFPHQPLGRYALGDRTKGLVRDANCALELHLRHQPP